LQNTKFGSAKGRIIYLVDTDKITTLKFPTFWLDPTPQGKFMLSIAFGQSKKNTFNKKIPKGFGIF